MMQASAEYKTDKSLCHGVKNRSKIAEQEGEKGHGGKNRKAAFYAIEGGIGDQGNRIQEQKDFLKKVSCLPVQQENPTRSPKR